MQTTGNVVTGDGGSGVDINDLSFASFENPGNNITGNLAQPDRRLLQPQFSATKGVLTNIGGGTTNCVEP